MKFTKFVLVFALAFSITVPGITQNTLSKIIKNGEIRIGMTGNQPPYSMKTKTDRLMGYEVDLATILAESMGVKLKMVELPFSELMPALQNGKIDAVMSGMTITPERNMKALFAGPYTLSGKSILTKSKVLAEISEAEEANLKKYKITVYVDLLDKLYLLYPCTKCDHYYKFYHCRHKDMFLLIFHYIFCIIQHFLDCN